MIISHKYKFIFIKTVKTAGTSIEVFLSTVCGDMDVVTPIYPPLEPHRARNAEGFFNHMPASLVKEKVPAAVWDSYYKFCVERNPWDKVISQYCMLNHRSGGKLSIRQYMTGPDLPINFPRYMDPAGDKVIVDRVLKYENLMEELGDVFRMLGVPFEGTLNVNAKSEYRTDRRPYQEVFTEEQARYVERVFAKEIDLHGYKFNQS